MARVFGSIACGEVDEEGDIDLIVDFEPSCSLLDHAGLWLELQELLGVKVDVVRRIVCRLLLGL